MPKGKRKAEAIYPKKKKKKNEKGKEEVAVVCKDVRKIPFPFSSLQKNSWVCIIILYSHKACMYLGGKQQLPGYWALSNMYKLSFCLSKGMLALIYSIIDLGLLNVEIKSGKLFLF